MKQVKKSIYDMNILIIDDALTNVTLLKAMLAQHGFTNTFGAFSVSHAFDLLEEHSFDLILLSFILPEFSGVEVCRLITSDMRYEDICIVMITANTAMDTLKNSFTNGACDYIAKPVNKVELFARVQAHLLRKQINDERKQSAIIDALTRLYNRRYFDEIFDNLYSKAFIEKRPLTFFMIDIDNFKPYNDNYGHQQGDEALKKVAKAFKSVLNRENDYLFRLGGEEFAILLYDTDQEYIHRLSQQLHEVLQSTNILHEHNHNTPYISVSMGITTASDFERVSKYNLYNSADKALYQAKELGRNRSVINQHS